MGMRPVDPNHRKNVRTDGRTDFHLLLAKGQVRSKHGRAISIHKPHNKWSALERDRLYQGYCEIAKHGASEEAIRTWIHERAAELHMSVDRARDVINQGNGEFAKDNMQWWRGVSITPA